MSDHDDWNPEVDQQKLRRYRKDGNDLSPSINQGQKIADFRNLAGMSITELATHVAIDKKELLALEAGLKELSPALAKQIAKTLGINFSDLWVDNKS